MAVQPTVVRVRIFGQEYGVKGDADADYIKKVAEYVDAKMRDVEETLTQGSSPLKIAVLAALNLTDELFMAWEERDKLKNDIEAKARALTERMNKALDDD